MAETWNIHPGKGTWVKCYVWDTPEEMRLYLDGKQDKGQWQKTEACYLGFDWTWEVEENGQTSFITRKLGELHFHNESMGAGIVAHEIQHFLTAWVVNMDWVKDLTGDRYWEPIAKLAGDLTREFWNGFYDRFEIKPGHEYG